MTENKSHMTDKSHSDYLNTMNKDGFTMGGEFDGIQLVWKDMIVEDLAMVLDYLRTGNW